MLIPQLLPLAAAALVGRAQALVQTHNGAISLRSLSAYGYQLAKRQSNEEIADQLAAEAGPPSECTEQCSAYFQESAKCYPREDGSGPSESDFSACICNAAYFNTVVTCMICVPDAFEDTVLKGKDVIRHSVQVACNCNGLPFNLDSVDMSQLGEGNPSVPVDACNNGNNGEGQPTSSLTNAGMINGLMMEEDTPTFTAASTTFRPTTRSLTAGTAHISASTIVSSTFASGTGAASAMHAQRVLALSLSSAALVVSLLYTL